MSYATGAWHNLFVLGVLQSEDEEPMWHVKRVRTSYTDRARDCSFWGLDSKPPVSPQAQGEELPGSLHILRGAGGGTKVVGVITCDPDLPKSRKP